MLFYSAEQKFCSAFMQLLLPDLSTNLKNWIKSYKKQLSNFEKGGEGKDLTNLVAYDEECALFKIQHYWSTPLFTYSHPLNEGHRDSNQEFGRDIEGTT